MVLRRQSPALGAGTSMSNSTNLQTFLIALALRTVSALDSKSLPPTAAATTLPAEAVAETAAERTASTTTNSDYWESYNRSPDNDSDSKRPDEENYNQSLLPYVTPNLPGSGAWFPKGEPRSSHGQGKEKENKEYFRDNKFSNDEVYIQEAQRLMRSLVPTSSPEVPGPLLLTPAYSQMMTNASKFSSQDDIIKEMQTNLLNKTPKEQEEHDESHVKSKNVNIPEEYS